MLKPMNQHDLNLLQLASLLDDAHAEYEAMPTLRVKNHQGGVDVHGYLQDVYMHACGTPACAIGHWLIDHLKIDCRVNNFGLYAPHVAARDFGVISLWDYDRLFGEHGCGGAQTAGEAAAFIREFVAERQKMTQFEMPLLAGDALIIGMDVGEILHDEHEAVTP